jgi:hypothetical protein
VPDEIVVTRLITRRGGWAETLAVEGIVRPAIRKLLAKALADLEPQIRRHGDVPLVEQPVEICAQQETVGDFVWAGKMIWLDVGGLEDRQGVFLGDGASPGTRCPSISTITAPVDQLQQTPQSFELIVVSHAVREFCRAKGPAVNDRCRHGRTAPSAGDGCQRRGRHHVAQGARKATGTKRGGRRPGRGTCDR